MKIEKLLPQNKEQEYMVQVLLAKMQNKKVYYRWASGVKGDWTLSGENRGIDFNYEYKIGDDNNAIAFQKINMQELSIFDFYYAQVVNGLLAKGGVNASRVQILGKEIALSMIQQRESLKCQD